VGCLPRRRRSLCVARRNRPRQLRGYVTGKPNEAAAKPASLSYIEAAAVPLAALAAWQGLFDHGQTQVGQTVLIHGGSGGVGHFAIQFAKVKGATVFTTVSRQNIDFVNELGADRAIDYQSQRFEEVVRDVDVVFDLVDGETRERSWSVPKPGGHSCLGAGRALAGEACAAWGARRRFQGSTRWDATRRDRSLIDEGKVRPFVSATYPLAEARHAQERLEQGHVRGKIVLVVAE
jgi:NADPH:quinone reductase-like Zn-dependent oxidoreductase